MKVLCFLVLVWVALAAPQQNGGQKLQRSGPMLRKLHSTRSNLEASNYDKAFQVMYDIPQPGRGIVPIDHLKITERDADIIKPKVSQGAYSYTAADGVVYTVNYIADEKGFRSEGAHVPAPPLLPVSNKAP